MSARLSTLVDRLGVSVQELDAEVFTILHEGAKSIVAGAKRRVHIDTAALYDSIRIEVVSRSPPHIQVKAGGIGVNPRTGRVVDYAAAHEADYPYMAPAVLSAAPQIRQALHAVLSRRFGELNERV